MNSSVPLISGKFMLSSVIYSLFFFQNDQVQLIFIRSSVPQNVIRYINILMGWLPFFSPTSPTTVCCCPRTVVCVVQ